MTTKHNDQHDFAGGVKIDGLALSAISSATAQQWTVTNFTTATRSIAGNETTAANIAAAVASLVFELRERGIIGGA